MAATPAAAAAPRCPRSPNEDATREPKITCSSLWSWPMIADGGYCYVRRSRRGLSWSATGRRHRPRRRHHPGRERLGLEGRRDQVKGSSRDGCRSRRSARLSLLGSAWPLLAALEPSGTLGSPSRVESLQALEATKRADKAWKAAKLDRITLHECRHTFASLMIAAGVNAKALQTFMGHANISDHLGPLRPPDARLGG